MSRAFRFFGPVGSKGAMTMRWLGLATAGSFLLIINGAITYAGCSTCGGNDANGYRSYRGPACFSPPGYCLAPGCCECPPSACDNAWDGYCEEKAKWQAFFSRVGTPKAHYHGCPAMVPVEACNNTPADQSAVLTQPRPAAKSAISPIPNAPVMTPSRASSKSDSQWFR
jgi:hypothetical protein